MGDGSMNEIIVENGKYRCPECGSIRITEVSQCVVIKMNNVNTGHLINPITGKGYMSNRQKAGEYDSASGDGVGCWFYERRKCGWHSEILME